MVGKKKIYLHVGKWNKEEILGCLMPGNNLKTLIEALFPSGVSLAALQLII